MKEWKTYRIGDICKTNTSQYSIKEAWDEFLYLDTGNITRNTIDEIARYSSAAELPSRARRKVICDDIIFSTVRPNQCHFGILSNPPTNLLVSTGFTVITANKEVVDPYYLYYYLSQDSIIDYLHSIGEQAVSAYPSIKSQDIEDLEIELPDLATQNNITKTLRALDNKIELNRKINDNLEQQAQAAFNNIIAQYSECETINLSEIAVLNPKRAIAKGTLARSIEMAQLPTSGSFPAGWDMKEYNGGMKFQNGDTLMARITPCLENGKVAYINFLEENEVAFGSTEYIVIASKGAIAPEVFYFLTRHNDFVDFAVKNMNGSSGRQRVSAETIDTYKLPIISSEDMFILETIAKEALNKIKYNSLENIRLSEIRDTLLPKLMSGELKINNLDC